jgi:hypothetical protein
MERWEEGYLKQLINLLTAALTFFRLQMDLADDLLVRLNLASGFRAPNLAEVNF